MNFGISDYYIQVSPAWIVFINVLMVFPISNIMIFISALFVENLRLHITTIIPTVHQLLHMLVNYFPNMNIVGGHKYFCVHMYVYIRA